MVVVRGLNFDLIVILFQLMRTFLIGVNGVLVTSLVVPVKCNEPENVIHLLPHVVGKIVRISVLFMKLHRAMDHLNVLVSTMPYPNI